MHARLLHTIKGFCLGRLIRHGGGVLRNISGSLVAIVIPEGAHHLDFMFSNELDPPSVLAARARQRALMRQWIAEAAARRRAPPLATPLLS
jgi:lysosomal Pro-X carboxypeptidase